MIDLDGIDLLGYESGTSNFLIDPSAGFEIGSSPADLQWVPCRYGALPLPDPSYKPLETELPMICLGDGDDQILEAIGELRQKAEKIQAQAGLGGTEITWQMLGTSYESTLTCYAASIGPVKIVADDKWMRVGRFTLTLTCAPFILGPEYTLASGTKAAGLPSADITIADAKGDMPGPMRAVITNRGTVAQQFTLLGSQWRDAVTGNDMLLRASTLDYSTAPLNGSYTAGTNEVQTLTKSGTISGGAIDVSFEGDTYNLSASTNAATLQAALEAFDAIGAGNVAVTGGPLNTASFTITFQNDLGARNLAAIAVANSTLTGGGSVSVTQTTAGVEGYVSTNVYSDYSAFVRSADQTDTGSYQLWARVQDQGSVANAVKIRASWSVGDTASSRTNNAVTIPAVAAPIWVYLGDAHITPPESGTHRWNFTIEAKTLGTAGTSLRVIDLQKVPVGMGRARVNSPAPGDSGTLSMVENFGATSGPLTGDTSTSGQTWASIGGSASATDFTESAAPDNAVIRTADNDNSTDLRRGRGVVLGAGAPTDVRVAVDCATATVVDGQGVIARFTNANNFVFGGLSWVLASPNVRLGYYLVKVVGGAVATVAYTEQTLPDTSGTRRVELSVYASGLISLAVDGVVRVSAHDPVFATGGTLAAGKSGILDWATAGGTGTRTYRDFRVAIPESAPVAIHPSRALHWQQNGDVEREASSGTYFAPAAGANRSGRPMIGPGGTEDLVNRLVIASADQNPQHAATTNQNPRLDWTLYHTPAYMLGNHEA